MTQFEEARTPRIAALDIVRGAAIVAMVVYHFGWNLSFFGLIGVDLRDQALWVWFGYAIAASFLVLVGIGLVLAHGGRLRIRAFLIRLGLVSGGAALVSAGTYLVLPDQFIYFGILHAIAVFSVLALPFLWMPAMGIMLVSLVVAVIPSLVQDGIFATPWLVWLGLSNHVPPTQDFVPLFPWFGSVLAGMALAKLFDFSRLTGADVPLRRVRPLAWAGRNSLGIYLAHQPVLFGALSLLAMSIASPQDHEARGFLTSCQIQCRNSGGDAVLCTTTCRCMVERLKSENLWASALANQLDPPQPRLEAIARQCAASGQAPVSR